VAAGGSLVAGGTASAPIYFTSLHDDSVGGDTDNNGTAPPPLPGDCDALYIDGSATLRYTHVLYGGGSQDACIFVRHAADVSLEYAQVAYRRNHGVWLMALSSSEIPTLSLDHTLIEHNTEYGVYVYSSVNGNDAYHNLTVTDSTIRDNGYGIRIDGWCTCSVQNSDISSNAKVGLQATAYSMVLKSNTFTDNGSCAASLTFIDEQIADLANNTGTGNDTNGILISGHIARDTTLGVNPILPYMLSGSTYVDSGVTLTLPAGTVIKYQSAAASLSVVAGGSLIAEGTASAPVYFTSLHDDSIAATPITRRRHKAHRELQSPGYRRLSHASAHACPLWWT
jgi:hypothetical protein